MEAGELLLVTPEDIVLAILKRREAMATNLPKELAARTEENDRAYALAREAKTHLESLPEGDENREKALAAYEENEAFRRRTASRLQVVKNSIADQEEALAFWKSMQEGDFGHLLDDAERVREGGPSSYARAKKQATKEGQS